jgi:hypothetical protein
MLTTLLTAPIRTLLPKATPPSLVKNPSALMTDTTTKADSFERTNPMMSVAKPVSTLRSGDRYIFKLNTQQWVNTKKYQSSLVLGLQNHAEVLARIINASWGGEGKTNHPQNCFRLFLGALNDTNPQKSTVHLIDSVFSRREGSVVGQFLKKNLTTYIDDNHRALMPIFWQQLNTYREQNFHNDYLLKTPYDLLREKEEWQLVRIAFEKGLMPQLAGDLTEIKPALGQHNPLGLEVCHLVSDNTLQFLIGTHEANHLNPVVLDEMIGSPSLPENAIPRPILSARDKARLKLNLRLRENKLLDIVKTRCADAIDKDAGIVKINSCNLPSSHFDPMMFAAMYQSYFKGRNS